MLQDIKKVDYKIGPQKPAKGLKFFVETSLC